jgi:hypothetical protein
MFCVTEIHIKANKSEQAVAYTHLVINDFYKSTPKSLNSSLH